MLSQIILILYVLTCNNQWLRLYSHYVKVKKDNNNKGNWEFVMPPKYLNLFYTDQPQTLTHWVLHSVKTLAHVNSSSGLYLP